MNWITPPLTVAPLVLATLRQRLFLSIIMLATLFFGSATASANTSLPLNFHQVSPEIFRSAQPDATQMQAIEQQGIKTVLNLRQWNDDDSEAKGTHLVLRRVPINAAVINDDNVVSALREVRFAQKPLLVHCWHGSDRTGLVVAMYRLVFERANKSEVLAELRQPQFGYHETYYPNIARYINNVNVDLIRQRVLSDNRQPH
ncbi:protein-tyrosine-phosphatase [Serratia sp. S1B]|nr:protein-tyrosine-phosphatase [Serratia sp. S1B]